MRWLREKKSHHCPYRESNPSRPAPSLVAILTELPRLCRTVSSNYYQTPGCTVLQDESPQETGISGGLGRRELGPHGNNTVDSVPFMGSPARHNAVRNEALTTGSGRRDHYKWLWRKCQDWKLKVSPLGVDTICLKRVHIHEQMEQFTSFYTH
jgi:hypothetical protein